MILLSELSSLFKTIPLLPRYPSHYMATVILGTTLADTVDDNDDASQANGGRHARTRSSKLQPYFLTHSP